MYKKKNSGVFSSKLRSPDALPIRGPAIKTIKKRAIYVRACVTGIRDFCARGRTGRKLSDRTRARRERGVGGETLISLLLLSKNARGYRRVFENIIFFFFLITPRAFAGPAAKALRERERRKNHRAADTGAGPVTFSRGSRTGDDCDHNNYNRAGFFHVARPAVERVTYARPRRRLPPGRSPRRIGRQSA